MDSGNSGGSLSLQSSSGGGGGGDDEFDSRCGAGGEDSSPLSALLRQPPAPPCVLQGFGGSSFYGIQDLAAPPTSHWPSTAPLPAGTAAGVSPSLPPSSSCQEAPAARASRKRTRASRRAPTTVLTTDTSNFRAMVQEFTGVPAPPFASARLDHRLPSRPAAALSSPYLLRPFAHKIQQAATASPYQPHPSYIATSPANKAAVASSTAPRRTTTAAASPGATYQLASAVRLGMQDHGSSAGNYLSFQSPVGTDATTYPAPAAHHMLDAPGQRLPDPAGFSGLAHGQMSSRHGGDDELSGLVGAASVSGAADGCKTTTYSTTSNAQGITTVAAGAATATTTMPVESSWICTSE